MPRRPMGPAPKMEKGRMKEVMIRLMGYITGVYRFQFVVVVLCILATAIGSVFGTKMLQYLIDDGITPLIGQSNPDYSALKMAVVGMIIAYSIVTITTYVYSRLMINISQGALKTLRDQMQAHMQTLPIRYFDTNANGDIMSRYTNDTDTLRQMISQGIPQLLSSFITIVTVFISMLLLSVHLTIVVVLALLVMIQVIKVLGGKSSKYYVAQQKSLGKVNGYIEEMMNGQKVIKVFNHEGQSIDGFDVLNNELFDNASKANILGNIIMPIMAQMGNLVYFLIAVLGAALAIKGVIPITLGVLAAFLQYTRNFTNPVTQVSQQVNAVVMALAGADRIFTLLDEQSEEDQGNVTLVNAKINTDGSVEETEERTEHWAWKQVQPDGMVKYRELTGYVEFEHVTFGYTPEKTVLKDLTLYAKPGQKIAFVGHTGAGKTTITNLINRFYDISAGTILYDGINIKDMKKSDLRRSLGIVLQDTHLYTGTIMENIRYGRLNATDEEVKQAAKLANADFFIRHLPEGYETVITGDGGNLSQGQRQLLAIARAAVADPPVLILDEATSSIDTRTEAIIQDGMDRLMEGRTVFVIAHRLSTVQNAKAILLLENGEVEERGDHEELMNLRQKYYQLYTGAFELS